MLGLVAARVGGAVAAPAFSLALAPRTSRVSFAAAATTSFTAAALAAVTTAAHPGGGRSRTSIRRADELDALGRGLAAAGLWREHLGDEDAVNLELSVDAQHISCSGALWQQAAIQHAFRLFRSCGAPCPRAVVTPAGQLDFEATAHGAFTNTRGRVVLGARATALDCRPDLVVDAGRAVNPGTDPCRSCLARYRPVRQMTQRGASSAVLSTATAGVRLPNGAIRLSRRARPLTLCNTSRP